MDSFISKLGSFDWLLKSKLGSFDRRQHLFDVDMLLNDECEGLEKIDENQEEKEQGEEEDDEEVVITGERKDYNNSSYDDDNSGGTGGVGGSGKTIEDAEQEIPTNTEYKKYEYEQQKTYVEEDGSVIGKLNMLVDERELFTVSEDIESPYKRQKTSKIDKSTWWTVTEKLSIVEKITQTIKTSKIDKSISMDDIRELSQLKMINPSNNSFAANFEEFLKRECGKAKFEKFKPQNHLPEVRVFDPVDLCSFSDDDLKILYKNPIRCDMSMKIKTESKFYMRVVARCLSRRHEAEVIKKRLAALDAKKLSVKVKTKPSKDNF
ncbi:hypothetical protein L1987_19139 [Smallanthus sonchifolius]|uniref:Uncharacterized protein n=1 Tax=Smallanthus sonchifolius TaxID=185202 RepID=A0ACB9J486_9ASTR|nr:hypothetical protein L1987_19139 [Smallanthus sonchifolius]